MKGFTWFGNIRKPVSTADVEIAVANSERTPIMNFTADNKPKKAYVSPALVVYGDVRTLTQTMGTTGATNDGVPPNVKTA